jgi:hypothetical protein
MISRRVCHHATLGACVIQHKDGIGRAASLKSADLLKILALKKQFHSARFIEPRTGQDRRAMNVGADPLMRRADTIKVDCQS